MGRLIKHTINFIVCAAALLGVQAGTEKTASADTSCAGAGYLCFKDYERASSPYGNVSGTNPDWRAFGWDNKADWFRNDGRTHNACIYSGYSYSVSWYHLSRGETQEWRNIVSSNNWTTSQNCPYRPL